MSVVDWSAIAYNIKASSFMADESADSQQVTISVDKIQLNQSRIPLDAKTLQHQNKMLRSQNSQLKKQLQSFSIRLDAQISKRLHPTKSSLNKEQDSTSALELQSAYKKCQIYRKEALAYRKKYQTLTDDSHLQDLQSKVAENEKANAHLTEELKRVNRIVQLQSQGLAELGVEDYPSVVSQKEQLKQEVRFLKKELDRYRRSHEALHREKPDSFNLKERKGHSISKATPNKDQLQDKSSQKVKTQQALVPHDPETAGPSRKTSDRKRENMKDLQAQRTKLRELVDSLKAQVDSLKAQVDGLKAQVGGLKAQVGGLRAQMAEKEKQNAYLKDKIEQLRMNNQLLLSQAIGRPGESKQKRKGQSKLKLVESQLLQPAAQQLKDSPAKKVKKRSSKQPSSQMQLNPISRLTSYLLRKEETASKTTSLLKWNHQHLSSKIKQLQILQHHDGHIKDLHVKYQKGEPKNYGAGPTHKYRDEHIKHVEGAFQQGYLQFLQVRSNLNRTEDYGKLEYQDSSKGEHFRFEVGSDEFPGALFGQHDEIGITKLGCFIHKETD